MKREAMRPRKAILNCSNMGTLSDGFVGRMIDKALVEVQEDIDRRGHDRQNREINIKLKFKQVGDQGKTRVVVHADIKSKLPSQVPPTTTCVLDSDAGGLVFSQDCAENPDQLTVLPYIDELTGEVLDAPPVAK